MTKNQKAVHHQAWVAIIRGGPDELKAAHQAVADVLVSLVGYRIRQRFEYLRHRLVAKRRQLYIAELKADLDRAFADVARSLNGDFNTAEAALEQIRGRLELIQRTPHVESDLAKRCGRSPSQYARFLRESLAEAEKLISDKLPAGIHQMGSSGQHLNTFEPTYPKAYCEDLLGPCLLHLGS